MFSCPSFGLTGAGGSGGEMTCSASNGESDSSGAVCSINPDREGREACEDPALSYAAGYGLGVPPESDSGSPIKAASTHLRGVQVLLFYSHITISYHKTFGTGLHCVLMHFYSVLPRQLHFHCSDVGVTRCCNSIGSMPRQFPLFPCRTTWKKKQHPAPDTIFQRCSLLVVLSFVYDWCPVNALRAAFLAVARVSISSSW